MKTARCPECGQSGLSWRDRGGMRWLVRYGTEVRHRCANAIDAPLTEREPGDIEVPPADLAELDSPNRPRNDRVVMNVSQHPVNSATTQTAESFSRVIMDLLASSSLNEPRVRAMISEAISEIELPKASAIEIRVPDHVPVEIPSAHRLLPQLVQYAALRLNTLLVGPAGSGKTTAGQQAAEALKLPYYEIGMGPHTSQWDLLGYLSPDGRYVPGKLREPYEHGGLFFVDEIDNSNPSALVTLNSAIANGHCAFPDGMVPRHPDFCLVAGANTFGRGADRLYVGRQQLDASTLDRFAVIEWDYDESKELAWSGGDAPEWVAFVQRVRKAAFELRLRFVVSPRASIMGAALLRAGRHRDEVEASVLWKGISQDDLSKLRSQYQGLRS